MLLDAAASPLLGANGTVEKPSVIMVFDGPSPPGKVSTILKRHEERIEKSGAFASDLMSGATPDHRPGGRGRDRAGDHPPFILC
jgi:hypothetical protein